MLENNIKNQIIDIVFLALIIDKPESSERWGDCFRVEWWDYCGSDLPVQSSEYTVVLFPQPPDCLSKEKSVIHTLFLNLFP